MLLLTFILSMKTWNFPRCTLMNLSRTITYISTIKFQIMIKKTSRLLKEKPQICEEGGAHLTICVLAFIDELEKQIILKKTAEVGQ